MRRGAATREALLDAALEVMSERGYHAASVPEVAARAGIGAATMYRHFEGKEALVNAVYLHAKRRFAQLVLEDFPADLPVRRAFQVLWERFSRIVVEERPLLVFLELHHHATYLTEETVAACEDLVAKPMQALLRRGQEEGVVRKGDPRFLYTFLEGTFFGLAKAAIGRGGPVNAELLRKGEPLIWAAIRA